MNQSATRKELLCVTFTQPSTTATDIQRKNIAIMQAHCDWAVVLYNGTTESIGRFCAGSNSTQRLVHCARNADTLIARTAVDPNHNNTTVVLSTPKTVLYHDLLPLLPRYRRVLLLDDDISLVSFNYTAFEHIWNCAFAYPPLIVQPLITSSMNQDIIYVNAQQWSTNHSSVLASGVGMVEQQVPCFDAIFFEWFVKRVLTQTKSFALQYGADWGHDFSWCSAARDYAKEVLGITHPAPCAVITGSTPVTHLNLRSMQNKRRHRLFFQTNAVTVVKHYMQLFPTWVSSYGSQHNPLLEKNKQRYAMAYKLSYCSHE